MEKLKTLEFSESKNTTHNKSAKQSMINKNKNNSNNKDDVTTNKKVFKK
jgi:hypothetical protein